MLWKGMLLRGEAKLRMATGILVWWVRQSSWNVFVMRPSKFPSNLPKVDHMLSAALVVLVEMSHRIIFLSSSSPKGNICQKSLSLTGEGATKKCLAIVHAETSNKNFPLWGRIGKEWLCNTNTGPPYQEDALIPNIWHYWILFTP